MHLEPNRFSNPEQRKEHRDFLNRYYGFSKYIYDITRKYYLFGRDRVIDQLVAEQSWSHLVEMGPGTGRNLRKIHGARPDALLGGIEACDEMLRYARQRCPWARFLHGFAETSVVSDVLRVAPERVLFSYCLSMVGDPEAALTNARRAIAKNGSVIAVDFADMRALPSWIAEPLQHWLRTFHVQSQRFTRLLSQASSVEYGPGRYYAIARFGPLGTAH